MNTIQDYFQEQAKLWTKIPFAQLDQAIAQLERARNEGRRIFLFGNGGSAATASHFACDLGKGTIKTNRPRFKVITLNDNVPTLTAYANDVNFETIFAEPLITLAERGDLAIAFSGSGNSPNIVRAAQAAAKVGVATIGFTGFDGGKLKDLADLNVHIPCDLFGQIEDVHLAMTHAICEILKLEHVPH